MRPLIHFLTRRFTFSASHRLWDPSLDALANARRYGTCTNLHGHNYRLEVTVRGRVDPACGFACNVLELRDLVDHLVVSRCDHQRLDTLDLFSGLVTTMENLASRMWDLLEAPLTERGLMLQELLLAETDDNQVRLRREDQA